MVDGKLNTNILRTFSLSIVIPMLFSAIYLFVIVKLSFLINCICLTFVLIPILQLIYLSSLPDSFPYFFFVTFCIFVSMCFSKYSGIHILTRCEPMPSAQTLLSLSAHTCTQRRIHTRQDFRSFRSSTHSLLELNCKE